MNLQASPASVEAAIDTTAAPGRQPSFAEQVRGQEARQVDLTLAMIMSDRKLPRQADISKVELPATC